MVLNTRKDFRANTLAEFISYAKTNRAKLHLARPEPVRLTHLGCGAAIGDYNYDHART